MILPSVFIRSPLIEGNKGEGGREDGCRSDENMIVHATITILIFFCFFLLLLLIVQHPLRLVLEYFIFSLTTFGSAASTTSGLIIY